MPGRMSSSMEHTRACLRGHRRRLNIRRIFDYMNHGRTRWAEPPARRRIDERSGTQRHQVSRRLYFGEVSTIRTRNAPFRKRLGRLYLPPAEASIWIHLSELDQKRETPSTTTQSTIMRAHTGRIQALTKGWSRCRGAMSSEYRAALVTGRIVGAHRPSTV